MESTAPVALPPPKKAQRKTLFAALAVAYALMAGAAFGTVPGDAQHLRDAVGAVSLQGSGVVPPLLLFLLDCAFYFQSWWWAFGAGFGGTGLLGLMGLLDRLLKPLLLLAVVLCVAVMGAAVYIHYEVRSVRGQMEKKAQDKGVELLEKGLQEKLRK